MRKPGFDVRCENPQFGNDGATTWNVSSSSWLDVKSGRILMTSRKLPGPMQILTAIDNHYGVEVQSLQPWQNNKGILFGFSPFWWTKWTSRSSSCPSTDIVVVNCGSLSFNLASACRQSYPSCQKLASRFTSCRGAPYFQSSEKVVWPGNVVRDSFVLSLSIAESGMEIW